MRRRLRRAEVKQKNPVFNGLAGAAAGAVSVVLTMPQDRRQERASVCLALPPEPKQ